MFYIGDQHFGTLTAFVPGSSAQNFTFTSALPVQVLKGMAPILSPYLQPGAHTLCQAPASTSVEYTQAPQPGVSYLSHAFE